MFLKGACWFLARNLEILVWRIFKALAAALTESKTEYLFVSLSKTSILWAGLPASLDLAFPYIGLFSPLLRSLKLARVLSECFRPKKGEPGSLLMLYSGSNKSI